ncbi:hypothetical protein SI65_09875 [Aspergillus cristatus]|uniref:ATPase AAA-type core domain-containing protein n=1 Tax=Aspergillus cristatus TaxID=573508 RepID=A0A1E3B2L1_ASPCR|nr:hypothetical protein SI65_09875 [Aspergillus cristatus]
MKYVAHSDLMFISVPFKFAALTAFAEIPEEDSDKESGGETGKELNNGRKEALILKSIPHGTDAAAWDIVKNGFELLHPTVMTADRGETHSSFRTIANDVYDYLTSTEPKLFSIAVFGQANSGKSIAVKKVFQTILHTHDEESVELELNLSQFQNVKGLQHELETIQDWNLKGKMPIVFFDEFDSTLGGGYNIFFPCTRDAINLTLEKFDNLDVVSTFLLEAPRKYSRIFQWYIRNF